MRPIWCFWLAAPALRLFNAAGKLRPAFQNKALSWCVLASLGWVGVGPGICLLAQRLSAGWSRRAARMEGSCPSRSAASLWLRCMG